MGAKIKPQPDKISPADLNDKERWQALFRGAILSTTTQKFFNYVSLADQKAQVLIILNSVLIPVAINGLSIPYLHNAAIVSMLTGITSIYMAIVCIFPKRRSGRKPDGTINLLHFGDIAPLKEQEFLDEFMPYYNDLGGLGKIVAKDLHDIARRVIRPKFFWLKLSYITFFIGNFVAIVFMLWALWISGMGTMPG
ncbi:MAG: DUF5706 domain-containing protein [Alphaproteobacteria bacterium]|nr:DUF5706 domain-containing protein [Alphaproteobacteria bacterium]